MNNRLVCAAIAARSEWRSVKAYYNIGESDIRESIYGEFFTRNICGREVLFYYSGNRKTNASAAAQYFISKYEPEAVIVAGTCAGINRKYKICDILMPNTAVQYDCSVVEIEPFITDKFTVTGLNESSDVTIGTADKPVVLYSDYLKIADAGIDIGDMESASVAYICKLNGVKCRIIKGISDFPPEKLEDWEKQYENYRVNSQIVMKNLLSEYIDKRLEELI